MRRVIDPATWDRELWFSGMRQTAMELVAEGADLELLARFDRSSNEWLEHHGVADPSRPFTILGPETKAGGLA